MTEGTPLVSLIVPCYNEQTTIRLLLEAIYHQTYSRSCLEVVIADGRSVDGTLEEVAAFQQTYPDLGIKIVDNPRRIIPAALNCAIQASQGQIIVRLDAHCVPALDYVRRCVDDLASGLGENVGGVWEIQPFSQGWLPRSIALAAAHPIGVGDAHYRLNGKAGAVDTVPFGAFQRELYERIGPFDERLLSNEDYEYNVRIRQSGGRVWLDPQIRSIYYARPNLSSLARQYGRYGYWKQRMLRRYPSTLRWRQALPPLFVASLIALLALSPWLLAARLLLGAEALVYALAVVAGSAPVAFRLKDLRLLFGIPVAICVMHFVWGAGFLWSALNQGMR